MTKEEILSLLQAQILILRDRPAELHDNPKLMADWVAKITTIVRDIESLNSCDANWLNDEYGKWWHKEIKPFVDQLDPNLLKPFNS